ncbi:MAG: hypothetical protein QXS54_07490 [Candidatus Methanomethylicaceae archaeon]
MMSQQQNKVVIKRLTDDALNRADWIAKLRKLFVSSDGIAAVVGDAHCLVHDLEHHRWYHYQLPRKGWSSWALARDSARLWKLVIDGKLTMLDLRSGEWIAFQHHIDYGSVLYAEDDVVIAQCKNILAIDVLRLENDGLQRIVKIPLKFDFIPSAISSTFLPEENQFIILGNISDRHTLWRLNWNGESDLILDVEGYYPSLRFPFFVVLDKKGENLVYADLRENPVKPRYINLDLCLKHEQPGFPADWRLHGVSAFVFDNSLIAVLKPEYPYEQSAIIRLGKEKEFEIETKKVDGIWFNSDLCLLGRFLTLSGKWAYDLVARQEVPELPWSTLLRQAIQDEVERQQAADTTTTPIRTQAQESSDIDAFKVFLRASQYRLAEIIEGKSLEGAISSSQHSAIFFLDRVPSVYWLPRGADQLRHLLPELECLLDAEYGLVRVTFDEQERIWACDLSGKYIAVVHPDGQEGQGFVVPYRWSFQVKAIAACDNTVALANFNELVVYHHDEAEGCLKEMLRWRSEDEITKIKPDVEERGLWVVTNIRNSQRYVLKYLPLNGKVSVPRKVEEINQSIRILGDWPERVYFAYIDRSEHVLRYTLNPQKGWHRVPLQNLVYKYPHIVSMSSDGNAIFVLLDDDDGYPLIRLQADNAELISAFERKRNSIQFVRWGDWLVLYSKEPLVFKRAYANRAEITELPENKGILFFHLPTNQFYTKPFTYAITDALRRMLSSGARGFLKSPL